jgi:hypothetical protein
MRSPGTDPLLLGLAAGDGRAFEAHTTALPAVVPAVLAAGADGRRGGHRRRCSAAISGEAWRGSDIWPVRGLASGGAAVFARRTWQPAARYSADQAVARRIGWGLPHRAPAPSSAAPPPDAEVIALKIDGN